MRSPKLSPRLLETATAAARLAWQMGDQLGLTPAGHARLKVLVADATEAERSLADLAADGRRILDARPKEVTDGEP
jgi:phage terminase small subunit